MKYTEQDLKDLGVKNEAHCGQMASSLLALKAKYERKYFSLQINCHKCLHLRFSEYLHYLFK